MRQRFIYSVFIWIIALTIVQASPAGKVPAKYSALISKAFKNAGPNKVQLQKALRLAPSSQTEGVAFLIAYMPVRDLRSLKADFILENTALAYKARETFPWAKAIPDSVFLNDVLPYVSLNETRENWRKDFFERFSSRVKGCTTLAQAIDSVNKNINKVVQVEYNTKRKKPDQSPFESMQQHMATCSGLSIILADAFRAVGIPARVAGTAMWTNMRGNHNWVEVWLDGQWYFTEFYPDKLNHSWFLADAGKADPTKRLHWIFASSFKPAGTYFTLVWDEKIRYVHAFNVTDRYIKEYQEQLSGEKLKDDETLVSVVLQKDDSCSPDGNNRIAARIGVLSEGKEIDFGYSSSSTDDLNKFLKFKLKKNTEYLFVFTDTKGVKHQKVVKTADAAEDMIILSLK